jgi:hypothetical protein
MQLQREPLVKALSKMFDGAFFFSSLLLLCTEEKFLMYRKIEMLRQ